MKVDGESLRPYIAFVLGLPCSPFYAIDIASPPLKEFVKDLRSDKSGSRVRKKMRFSRYPP
jgi:hypothetical protein